MSLFLNVTLKSEFLKQKATIRTPNTLKFISNIYNRNSEHNYENNFACREELIRQYYFILSVIVRTLPEILGEDFDAFSEVGDVIESVEFGVNGLELNKIQIENLGKFINENCYEDLSKFEVSKDSVKMNGVFLFSSLLSLILLLMRNYSQLLFRPLNRYKLAAKIINGRMLMGDEALLTGLFIHIFFKEIPITIYSDNGSYLGPADYTSKMFYFYVGTESFNLFIKEYEDEILKQAEINRFWKLISKEI